jgi:hypothetical protein
MLFALDTETHLIQPGLLTPPLVCVSWAHSARDIGGNPATRDGYVRNFTFSDHEAYGERTLHAGVLRHDQALPLVEELLSTDDIILVGANVSYDMGVIAAKWPHLLRKIYAAYDHGRLRDVLIRQKLLDIAAGCYRGYFDQHNRWTQFGYSLDALSIRILGAKLDKGSDGWRMRYNELENVPLADWPKRALDYPCEDATTPILVHDAQEEYRERGWLEDEDRQCAADWALHLQSVYGVRTNPTRISKLVRETTTTLDRLREALVGGGLVRVKVGVRSKKVKITRDTKAAKARMEATMTGLGRPIKLTDTGQTSLDEDACDQSGDKLLSYYAQYTSLSTILTKDVPVLLAGTRVPIQPHYEILLETGRTSASGDAKGDGAIGYPIQTIRRSMEPRCPMCEAKNSPSALKCKKCEFAMIPVTGIRECFAPRFGWLYADADYDGVELRGFSQVCINTVGFSRMGERLNAGMDVHLDVAAQLLSITYEYAYEALKGKHGDEWQKKVKDARQLAKALNFGLPGGLSAAGRDGHGGFREYARASFGLNLSAERCVELKEQWFATWPEASEYFRWVRTQLDPVTQKAHLIQFYSGRHRGEVSFTEAANGNFQALAADAAKASLYAISRACYIETESPLYGSRPVMFIHDQIICEVPIPVAHEAATELGRLMCLHGSKFMPDVPLTTTPCLSTCFSKDAEAIYDANGRLLPWSPKGEEAAWAA